ncbi:MAG: hypothetical protein K6360_05670 [Deltaproteobacteria bacterium]
MDGGAHGQGSNGKSAPMDRRLFAARNKYPGRRPTDSGITLVGDRGMIKQWQIDLLSEHDFHYIAAITRPQIHALINKGVMLLGLFDDQL